MSKRHFNNIFIFFDSRHRLYRYTRKKSSNDLRRTNRTNVSFFVHQESGGHPKLHCISGASSLVFLVCDNWLDYRKRPHFMASSDQP